MQWDHFKIYSFGGHLEIQDGHQGTFVFLYIFVLITLESLYYGLEIHIVISNTTLFHPRINSLEENYNLFTRSHMQSEIWGH